MSESDQSFESSPWTTFLSWDEVRESVALAAERRIVSRQDGLWDYMPIYDSWKVEIEGALGECGYGKIFGLPWGKTVNSFKKADFPPITQVRATEWGTGGCIVRPHDPDDHLYALLILNSNFKEGIFCSYRGYIRGADAKALDIYRWDPNKADRLYGAKDRHCWMIPQTDSENLIREPIPQ